MPLHDTLDPFLTQVCWAKGSLSRGAHSRVSEDDVHGFLNSLKITKYHLASAFMVGEVGHGLCYLTAFACGAVLPAGVAVEVRVLALNEGFNQTLVRITLGLVSPY